MKGGEAIHVKEKHIQDTPAKQAGENQGAISTYQALVSAQKEHVLSTTKTFIKLKKLLDISFSIAYHLIAKLKNFFWSSANNLPSKNLRCFLVDP